MMGLYERVNVERMVAAADMMAPSGMLDEEFTTDYAIVSDGRSMTINFDGNPFHISRYYLTNMGIALEHHGTMEIELRILASGPFTRGGDSVITPQTIKECSVLDILKIANQKIIERG